MGIHLPPLHPGQREVAESKARFKVLSCGRRWGKTALSAALATKEAKLGKRVLWVAPTHPQVLEGWRYVRWLSTQLPGVRVKSGSAERVAAFPGGGTIEGRSSDDPDNLRGGGFGLAILDECRDIQERTWYEIIRPALMDTQGGAIFISTPRGWDWFYDLYQNGVMEKPGWAAWQLPSHNNPWLDRGELAELEAETKAKGGQRLFSQEILAEFLPDGGGVFRGVRAASCVAPEHPSGQHNYTAFWDTAKTDDSNAIAVFRRDGNTLRQVYADCWTGVEWPVSLNRVRGLRAFRGDLYMDVTGTNIYGDAGIAQVQSVVGPALRVSGHRFDNRGKDDMTRGLSRMLELGEVKLLDPAECADPDMKAAAQRQILELEAWKGTRLPSGLTRYSGPDGQHDDMAVAVMAACQLSANDPVSVQAVWSGLGGLY